MPIRAPEQPQPDRGQGAGVEREQPGPGLVEDAERAPDPDAGAGPDGVDARRSMPEGEQPAPAPRISSDQRRRTRRARPAAATAGPAAARRRARRRPRTTGTSTDAAGESTASPGSAAMRTAITPYRPTSHARCSRRRLRRGHGPAGLGATALGGRAGPVLAGRDLAHDQRARAPPRPPCRTTAPGRQRAAGADPGARADPDLADVEDVAVDPVAGEVDLGLDRRALADRQQAGDRRQRVQVGALADVVAEQAGVEAGTTARRPATVAASSSWIRSASQIRRWILPPRGWSPGVDRPQHERGPAAPASVIRPGRDQEEPGGQDQHPDRGTTAARRGRAAGPRPWSRAAASSASAPPASARSGTRASSWPTWVLSGMRHGPCGRWPTVAAAQRRARASASAAMRGVGVDVADDDLGVPLTQPADHLRGGQRAAAEVEEVVRRARSPRRPARRPRSRRSRPGSRRGRPARLRGPGQRPGQRVAVDLAARSGSAGCRPRPAGGPARRAAGARSSSSAVAASYDVVDGEVADQQLVAGLGRADRGRGAGDAGQPQQLLVDLAELDPAPAQLDLVVGAAGEDQAGGSLRTTSPER